MKNAFVSYLSAFGRCESGQPIVEYIILSGSLAIALVAVFMFAGGRSSNTFNCAGNAMTPGGQCSVSPGSGSGSNGGSATAVPVATVAPATAAPTVAPTAVPSSAAAASSSSTPPPCSAAVNTAALSDGGVTGSVVGSVGVGGLLGVSTANGIGVSGSNSGVASSTCIDLLGHELSLNVNGVITDTGVYVAAVLNSATPVPSPTTGANLGIGP